MMGQSSGPLEYIYVQTLNHPSEVRIRDVRLTKKSWQHTLPKTDEKKTLLPDSLFSY